MMNMNNKEPQPCIVKIVFVL